MFTVDTAAKKITLHRGDTGTVPFYVTGYEFSSTDRVLFTMKSQSGEEIMKRIYQLDENGYFYVDFRNGDTDHLTPGQYVYDCRVAILPEFDEHGDIIDVDFDHGGAVSTPGSPFVIELLTTVGQI